MTMSLSARKSAGGRGGTEGGAVGEVEGFTSVLTVSEEVEGDRGLKVNSGLGDVGRSTNFNGILRLESYNEKLEPSAEGPCRVNRPSVPEHKVALKTRGAQS